MWSIDDACDVPSLRFLFVVSIRAIYNRLTFGLHENKVLRRRDRVIPETHKGLKRVTLICLPCSMLVNIHFRKYHIWNEKKR